MHFDFNRFQYNTKKSVIYIIVYKYNKYYKKTLFKVIYMIFMVHFLIWSVLILETEQYLNRLKNIFYV